MSRTYTPEGSRVRKGFLQAYRTHHLIEGVTPTKKQALRVRKEANLAGRRQSRAPRVKPSTSADVSHFGLDPTIGQ